MNIQLKKEKSDYQIQAENFLEVTGTTLNVEWIYTDKHFDDDKEKRDIYSVTLSNKRHSYTFRFGDSIYNTRRRAFAKNPDSVYSFDHRQAQKLGFKVKNNQISRMELLEASKHTPDAYDILACLTKYSVTTFSDFCSDYGYDEDSRKAFKVYEAVANEYKNVSKLFTAEELEQLAEIN